MKKLILIALSILSLSANAAVTISAGFTDSDSAEPLVIKAIQVAQKQILLAAYSFTSKPIAEELLRAHKRGVQVFVVVDKSQASERYTSATFIANAGIPIRIDRKHAIMHNKFMVIDSRTVQTGSFNYTKSAAERNAENVIQIDGDAAVVKAYTLEWKTHWDHSETYEARNR